MTPLQEVSHTVRKPLALPQKLDLRRTLPSFDHDVFADQRSVFHALSDLSSQGDIDFLLQTSTTNLGTQSRIICHLSPRRDTAAIPTRIHFHGRFSAVSNGTEPTTAGRLLRHLVACSMCADCGPRGMRSSHPIASTTSLSGHCHDAQAPAIAIPVQYPVRELERVPPGTLASGCRAIDTTTCRALKSW
ncbi:hypothetical protein M427DRAFT_152598 [Gonapodya prolifera JEL478]|uniref:Uncharacterized protein n=1 Tax=Gonapodya prolifera (strain JEL478) TaxID=1344416 RepID=A0A139AT21_GONPJ|nr:hypothetical protein M427DRAFT_152598 [Gonapodya prolifera JEL478]|eukprot:KXS19645.1 hypothetical protein M427DRAFT_152598 [Gonapodya prolifera JEL478]